MTFVRSSGLLKTFLVGLVITLFMVAVTQRRSTSVGKHYAPYINNLNYKAENKNVIVNDYTDASTENMFVEDGMPGAFLKNFQPIKPANKSYCKFNYGLPYDLKNKAKHINFPPEQGRRSPYRVLINVTEAWHFNGVPKVTYASHVTADFVYYIPEILRHWDGFVSIAAFVPDLDAALFLEQINQYCYCLPAMSRLSLHLIYHKQIFMSRKDIYFTKPKNCLVQDSSKIKTYRHFDETVVYPVNVLRNVARNSSLTKYVVVSDIELMPSKDLAQKFLTMIQKYNKTNLKEVFVIPIFEVEETEKIPRTKLELLELLGNKKAVYFHGLVCSHCQKFPGIEDWIQSDPGNSIQPFVTTKREDPYHRWEPIFIGTNTEPLYNEKLSWDGLQDKMPQSLEMCLQGYDYTILDGCFLIHWPGIKKNKVVAEDWRIPFVKDNFEIYKNILGTFYKKYKIIPQCRIETKSKLPGFNLTEDNILR